MHEKFSSTTAGAAAGGTVNAALEQKVWLSVGTSTVPQYREAAYLTRKLEILLQYFPAYNTDLHGSS